MRSDLDNLERLRQNLEENISKLKTSLRHWQTWEFEYSGLKEELERPEEEPSVEKMLEIALDQECEVLDEKEIKSLLNYGKQPPRTRSEVLAQIRGRIDTGKRNADTLRKLLAATEEKLNSMLAAGDKSCVVGDADFEGQQMDIIEELDDNDNVISSRVINTSKDREKLREILRSKGFAEDETLEDQNVPEQDNGESKTVQQQTNTQPSDKYESVSSAPKTDNHGMNSAPPPNKMHPTQRMLVLDENDKIIDSKPLELVHATENSSSIEEETVIAQIREARANAKEIAPIVASFDIEPASDDDTETDLEDYEDDENDENEYGMNDIGTELTDDYKAQMEALMQKHAVALENVGPNFDYEVLRKLETAHRDSALVVSSARREDVKPSQSAASSRKGVRFAEELDISKPVENKELSSSTNSERILDKRVLKPVADAILEHSSHDAPSEGRIGTTRKVSRFKTLRNTTFNAAPATKSPS
ncbi:uncharacterized protein PV09_04731 [Verruconis gallopava]|uniref:DUF3835 domain-containing protein n=1 Tax=Verruconis gallopava TaxID=253628 RepID=A0A0D1XPI7_9PEZI|nr:uncharacterized protein PV09_04731 [Verruconis gallopava]KIW04471.1 hypothetical protein PV09_04731 [Verruconis gallopava]